MTSSLTDRMVIFPLEIAEPAAELLRWFKQDPQELDEVLALFLATLESPVDNRRVGASILALIHQQLLIPRRRATVGLRTARFEQLLERHASHAPSHRLADFFGALVCLIQPLRVAQDESVRKGEDA